MLNKRPHITFPLFPFLFSISLSSLFLFPFPFLLHQSISPSLPPSLLLSVLVCCCHNPLLLLFSACPQTLTHTHTHTYTHVPPSVPKPSNQRAEVWHIPRGVGRPSLISLILPGCIDKV